MPSSTGPVMRLDRLALGLAIGCLVLWWLVSSRPLDPHDGSFVFDPRFLKVTLVLVAAGLSIRLLTGLSIAWSAILAVAPFCTWLLVVTRGLIGLSLIGLVLGIAWLAASAAVGALAAASLTRARVDY